MYSISFYDNQNAKQIYNQEKILKYLAPYKHLEENGKIIHRQDKYTFDLKGRNKIILDLVVYSGDAYIDSLSLTFGCTFYKYHYGSNERRIFECENRDTEKVKSLTFQIRANSDGAVYLIYIQEKPEDTLDDFWPIEMTTL